MCESRTGGLGPDCRNQLIPKRLGEIASEITTLIAEA